MSRSASRSFYLLRLSFALVLALVGAGAPVASAQVFRAMVPRYEVTTNGRLVILGNASTTCLAGSYNDRAGSTPPSTGDVLCSTTQTQGPALSPTNSTANDRYRIVNIDIDSDAATYNSSSSDLTIPATATVRFAALFWGARRLPGLPDSSARNTVKLQTPGATGYTTVTAQQLTFPNAVTKAWGAYADVTALVQAARGGTYTVADVVTSQSTTGVYANYAGWSLFVVLEDPTEPLRYMSVSDGLITVDPSNRYSGVFDGFVTPLTGAYTPKVATFVLDGDNDANFAISDSLVLNGVALTNAVNPANNYFNSTISENGANVTSRSPSYAGTLGTDIDVSTIPTATIPNGSRSVNVRMTTVGETYNLHAVAFQSEVYNPEMTIDKRVSDVNGGSVDAGDVLEYTITVSNNQVANGYNVYLKDPIPLGTTYVPGSMTIGGVAKTDAAGDDQANRMITSGAQDTLLFRIGTGANATTGGTVNVNTSTVLKFRVTLNSGLPAGTGIFNRATLNYNENSSGGTLVSESDASIATPAAGADLQVVKTISGGTTTFQEGDNVTFSIAYSNLGTASASTVRVQDMLPPGMTFVSATKPSAWTGSYPTVGTNGPIAWTQSSSASGNTATFTVTAKVSSVAATGTWQNKASVSSATNDPLPDNNESAVSFTAKPLIDLKVSKTVSPSSATVGQSVTYTVTVQNERATTASGVTVNDLLPSGLTFVSATPSQGTYVSSTGVWTVGTVGPNASKTLTIVATVAATGTITNTAQVASASESDVDSTPGNSVSTEDDQASVSFVSTFGASDLAVSYTTSKATPALNETFTLSLTVTNQHASQLATGVQVAAFLNNLPPGVQVVSITPPQGTSYDNKIWNVRSLAAGASSVLNIQVRFISAQTVTSCAEVARMNQSDVDSTPYNGIGEDDRACVTVGTAGSSSSGVGGLESNGGLSQDLARVLYARTQQRTPAPVAFSKDRPAYSVLGSDDDGARLMALVPATGPEASAPVVVTPGDLLGVTNATGVLGVDYLRPVDRQRMGALLMLATPDGQIYEHTKAICDRLRAAALVGLDTVTVRGRSFVVNTLRYDDGTVDYAASFIAYGANGAPTVDSRFLMNDYAVPAGMAVTNVQVWSPSREYTRGMIEQVLRNLGEVSFRDGTPLALPKVFVERAEYRDGALHLRVNNAAGARQLTLSGSTLARAEGAAHVPFSGEVALPQDSATVWVTVPTGPLFDAGFFVESDLGGAADQLYLADGAWSVAPSASADASVDAFAVAAEDADLSTAPGVRYVERSPSIAGKVTTSVTLFRYLRAGGQPLDLDAFRYLDVTLEGQGQVMLRLERPGESGQNEIFYRTLRLTEAAKRHRIELQDFRSADGQRFDGVATVLSFVVVGNSNHETPYALTVSQTRFAGGAGDVSGDVPEETLLEAPAPNPARSRSLVQYRLAEAGPVRLSVYDVLGREVLAVRHDDTSAGFHRAEVDVSALPAGRYVLVLDAGRKRYSQPLVVVH